MDDGRIESLASLYQAHGPDLLRYLRRPDAAAGPSAEDLLQETFIQAMRRADALAGVRSPRAWLFGIARHVTLTAARRARPMQTLNLETVAADGGQLIAEDPRLEPMRSAIGRLPDVLRETLELRLRDELSYDEIADVLAVPVGTVRSRLHHAMRRLREAVAPAASEAGVVRPAARGE